MMKDSGQAMNEQLPTLQPRRTAVGRLSRLALWLVLGWTAVAGLSGCQIIIGLLMIARGNPKITADFTEKTGLKMNQKGRRVVVICNSIDSARSLYPALDQDLSTEVARNMRAQQIDVVDPHDVVRWMEDQGGKINTATFQKIGEKFNVDYVVLINIESYDYQPPGAVGLYQGSAKGVIKTVAMPSIKSKRFPRGGQVYVAPFSSEYPLNGPLPVEQTDPHVFQRQYVERLGEELARRFYDHPPGDEIMF